MDIPKSGKHASNLFWLPIQAEAGSKHWSGEKVKAQDSGLGFHDTMLAARWHQGLRTQQVPALTPPMLLPKGIFFMFEHYQQSPEGFPEHRTWFGPPVLLHLFLTISTHIGQGGESLLSNSMPPFME